MTRFQSRQVGRGSPSERLRVARRRGLAIERGHTFRSPCYCFAQPLILIPSHEFPAMRPTASPVLGSEHGPYCVGASVGLVSAAASLRLAALQRTGPWLPPLATAWFPQPTIQAVVEVH